MSLLKVVIIIFANLFVSTIPCIPTQHLEVHLTTTSTSSSTSTSTTTSTTTTTTTTTTTAPPACLSGWTTFQRTGYLWCMEVLMETVASYAKAEEACAKLDSLAVPTGFQSKAEFYTMAALIPKTEDYGLYIGAKRRTACLGQVLTATCNRLNTFNWTDGHTTGTDGFVWAPNQPDGFGLAYLPGNLILIHATGIAGEGPDMDDTADGPLNGVICGMEAQSPG